MEYLERGYGGRLGLTCAAPAEFVWEVAAAAHIEAKLVLATQQASLT